MTKIENYLAVVTLEEEEPTEKHKTLPKFTRGPSRVCSSAFGYLTMFPNETDPPKTGPLGQPRFRPGGITGVNICWLGKGRASK